MTVYAPLINSHFLNLVHFQIFNKAQRFGIRFCFRLQARKIPTIMDLLDRVILCHNPCLLVETEPAA